MSIEQRKAAQKLTQGDALACVRAAVQAGIDPAYHRVVAQRAVQSAPAEPTQAARDVLTERLRQVSAEGFTPEHDDGYEKHELTCAARAYMDGAQWVLSGCMPPGTPPTSWPWNAGLWNPTTPRNSLVKAAALLLAEIERIDRAAMTQAPQS